MFCRPHAQAPSPGAQAVAARAVLLLYQRGTAAAGRARAQSGVPSTAAGAQRGIPFQACVCQAALLSHDACLHAKMHRLTLCYRRIVSVFRMPRVFVKLWDILVGQRLQRTSISASQAQAITPQYKLFGYVSEA